MRPLGLTDTIFYNLGDAYITCAAILDGPCDLAAFVADTEEVVAALPGLSERPLRLGLWSFAVDAGPVALADHIAVVCDPGVTTIAGAMAILDRLRRSAIRHAGPPWRIFVLNPATPDGGQPPSGALSVLFMQLRHGLGDATRGLQILQRMGHARPTAAHAALARRLRTIDLAALGPKVAVHDEGLSVLQVPRRLMSRGGEASERLAAIAAKAVADARLFPHAQPLRGNVGRTHLLLRRGAANGVGNHIKMITVRTIERPQPKRFRIRGLARAQELPLSQWLVALSPRRIARLAMRIWYRNFDAIATLLPVPRNLQLGGRAVTAVFGVPPLWGPVPLVLVALADADQYHVTVIPGHGFAGDRRMLDERIRALFEPAAQPRAAGAAARTARAPAAAAPATAAYAKR
jgi:hypothetical protein